MLNINEIDFYIKKNYQPRKPLINTMCLSSPKIRKKQPEEVACDRSLEEIVSHLEDTFQEALFYLIDSKKLDEVEVYKDSHLDRKLFSKIRSDKDFRPSKKTAISLCFGLKLNLDETKDLLNKAGYSLSHSSLFDIIIEYCILHKEYDIMNVNEYLDRYGEPLLG